MIILTFLDLSANCPINHLIVWSLNISFFNSEKCPLQFQWAQGEIIKCYKSRAQRHSASCNVKPTNRTNKCLAVLLEKWLKRFIKYQNICWSTEHDQLIDWLLQIWLWLIEVTETAVSGQFFESLIKSEMCRMIQRSVWKQGTDKTSQTETTHPK